MWRMEARRKASALRLRHSQSLPSLLRVAERVRRPEDDHRAPRSKRKLALQEPRLSAVCDRDFVTSRLGVDHATQVDRRATDDPCPELITLQGHYAAWLEALPNNV